MTPRKSIRQLPPVALAWLIARPGVTAPIASATNREQLEGLFAATSLARQFTPEDSRLQFQWRIVRP
jgi:aryl-alcohol dehydrogenase-like predicted oxidoreductase